MNARVCPYIEASFAIIGKKWNGQILHYLFLCEERKAHFTDLKNGLSGITARALSTRLSELVEIGLIEKIVTNKSRVEIIYKLTEKGSALADSMKSIQEWAKAFINLEVGKDDKQ